MSRTTLILLTVLGILCVFALSYLSLDATLDGDPATFYE